MVYPVGVGSPPPHYTSTYVSHGAPAMQGHGGVKVRGHWFPPVSNVRWTCPLAPWKPPGRPIDRGSPQPATGPGPSRGAQGHAGEAPLGGGEGDVWNAQAACPTKVGCGSAPAAPPPMQPAQGGEGRPSFTQKCGNTGPRESHKPILRSRRRQSTFRTPPSRLAPPVRCT